MEKGLAKSGMKESRAKPRITRDYNVLSGGRTIRIRANHVFVFDGSVSFTDDVGFVAAFSPGSWTSVQHAISPPDDWKRPNGPLPTEKLR